MPHLMINLDDKVDCQQGLRMLRRRLKRHHGCNPWRPGDAVQVRGLKQPRSDTAADIAGLPLPQKLKRLQSRGMWKHLVKIAQSAPEPSSLPELDNLLGLPKNKMRSLKAIMAKLENRFGIQFLKVDPDAGVDAAGNPRYVMLPNVRRQILRLAAEQS